MRRNAAYWIERLRLEKHPEGGFYKEIYRSSLKIPATSLPSSFRGDRVASTSIYFLLEENQFSALHRIASDEVWHFYDGDCLAIFELTNEGNMRVHRLGNSPDEGESLQVIISAGNWFGAKPDNGSEYALVGCTVAPGFDFDDFEFAKRDTLITQYPVHERIIRSLTLE